MIHIWFACCRKSWIKWLIWWDHQSQLLHEFNLIHQIFCGGLIGLEMTSALSDQIMMRLAKEFQSWWHRYSRFIGVNLTKASIEEPVFHGLRLYALHRSKQRFARALIYFASTGRSLKYQNLVLWLHVNYLPTRHLRCPCQNARASMPSFCENELHQGESYLLPNHYIKSGNNCPPSHILFFYLVMTGELHFNVNLIFTYEIYCRKASPTTDCSEYIRQEVSIKRKWNVSHYWKIFWSSTRHSYEQRGR